MLCRIIVISFVYFGYWSQSIGQIADISDNSAFDDYIATTDSILIHDYELADTASLHRHLSIFESNYNKLPRLIQGQYKEQLASFYYNYACSLAVLFDSVNSLKNLYHAIELGFYDTDQIQSDPDLKFLHKNNQLAEVNLFVVEQGRRIFYASNNVKDRLQSAYHLALFYKDIQLDSMLHFAQIAAITAFKNRNDLGEYEYAQSLSTLAWAMWYAGNYPDSKSTYFRALEIAETLNDSLLLGEIYLGLGRVNRSEENFEKAIFYFKKTESLLQFKGSSGFRIAAISETGKCYEQINIIDTAYLYISSALNLIYAQYGDQNVLGGGAREYMGTIYSKIGQDAVAEMYFRQAIFLNKEKSDFRLLSRSYSELAEHFFRLEKRDSAIHYALLAHEIDDRLNYDAQYLNSSKLLSNLFQSKGDMTRAFYYLQKLIKIKDRLFSRANINKLHTLEFNEQIRQQEREQILQKAKVARWNNIQFAVIALCIIIFITLYIIFSHVVIANDRFISFFGALGLLFVFEFINLLIHPFAIKITHGSPLLLLLFLVLIAGILIPMHHKLEIWVKSVMIAKNHKIRSESVIKKKVKTV